MSQTFNCLEGAFNIKDSIPKRHNLDIIYHIVYQEDDTNEDYIGECVKRLKKGTKGHNGRDKNLYMLPHSIESGHNEVSKSDFQNIGKRYFCHTQGRTI